MKKADAVSRLILDSVECSYRIGQWRLDTRMPSCYDDYLMNGLMNKTK